MKAVDEKIGKFIGNSDTVFIIPPFQRNYSWDEEQCSELFDDILDSVKKNKSHYVGNIVYYVGENDRAGFNEYILVDGQQRITTILLLLCALRTKLPEEDRRRLERKFLINEDEPNEKYRIKLKQTDNDLRVFEKIINNSDLTAEERDNRLFKNYNYFIDKISDFSEEEANAFFSATTNLDIVDLNLKIEKDLESVQKIFEKINSTGKELSIADLIRNYLLISNSSKTQKFLYDNYWVKIESLYRDKEDISEFAKHYLITKRGIWAEEKKMYNTFKLYFDNSDMSKEDILKEILNYSKYFNWFLDETCPDDKMNISIKELNVLKSDDMYSLLLVLFDRLYNDNKAVLRKILDLLSDFMIRYRIVSPTNGSGDIRKTLFTVLSKITKNEIAPDYDSVLYELSNSPSPGGRFPEDGEFRASLSRYVNTGYAKALLYKLEYKEVKNIEVDIRKVTVEHLMPQTLSDDWKAYLGGEQKASLIYNTYINNIGNLALLSQPLNSKNSNDIWDNKKTNIKNSQFVLTNTIPMDCKWNDDAIKNRSAKIADLAIKHIVGPVKRDRDFETVEVSENFSSGVYEVKDIYNTNFRVTKRTIKSIVYDNVPYAVKGWFDLVHETARILYEVDPNLFENIIKRNLIHKSTYKYSYYFGNDPIICKEERYLVSPYKLDEAECYIECALSANRSLYYAIELIKAYDLLDKFKVEIE